MPSAPVSSQSPNRKEPPNAQGNHRQLPRSLSAQETRERQRRNQEKEILEDETFWVEHVDLETTLRIRNTIENAIANRKAIMAGKAVDQLKELGVVLPKGFDIKFAE